MLCLIAGVGAGVVVMRDLVPEVVSEAVGPDLVEVRTSVFADEISLPVEPVVLPAGAVLLAKAGVVTKETCVVGGAVTSGEVVVWLDDSPVVGLRLRVPPWRDIVRGAKGRDVRSLQRELRHLGYEAPATGVVDYTTVQAIRAFWQDRGRERVESVAMSDIAWLPEEGLTASECPLRLGSHASDGEAAVVTGGGLDRVEVDTERVAVSGARLARVDGFAVEMPADGVIEDAGFLNALGGSGIYKRWVAEEGLSTLTVETELATPIDVVGVPPSAVYELNGDSGCVTTPNGPIAVRVVTSQLGETFVVPAGDDVFSQVVAPAPEGAKSCG
ncbi:MAG: peptidoglycan-binding protein [Bifidobacteriaceae bacterium]|jgi:hypothetical protein|nr:peptidoglycan-binding protein [Bifidobacteriaceae bacterium]